MAIMRRPRLRATAFPELPSFGCRFARPDNADPVIGEFAVGSGQFNLRHVARRALLLAHRTGRSRVHGSFCLPTSAEVTSQTF